jgi:hypothetical protein
VVSAKLSCRGGLIFAVRLFDLSGTCSDIELVRILDFVFARFFFCFADTLPSLQHKCPHLLRQSSHTHMKLTLLGLYRDDCTCSSHLATC